MWDHHIIQIIKRTSSPKWINFPKTVKAPKKPQKYIKWCETKKIQIINQLIQQNIIAVPISLNFKVKPISYWSSSLLKMSFESQKKQEIIKTRNLKIVYLFELHHKMPTNGKDNVEKKKRYYRTLWNKQTNSFHVFGVIEL